MHIPRVAGRWFQVVVLYPIADLGAWGVETCAASGAACREPMPRGGAALVRGNEFDKGCVGGISSRSANNDTANAPQQTQITFEDQHQHPTEQSVKHNADTATPEWNNLPSTA